MIARAASACAVAPAHRRRAMMPSVTLRGSSDTPITPVDATSTSSASQPSARAVFGGHQLRDRRPGVAGARVGAAAVDDDRARPAAARGEMLARDDHRRRDGEVRREHAGGARRRRRRDEQREIELAVRLDAAVRRPRRGSLPAP